jgi:hypothetical protein
MHEDVRNRNVATVERLYQAERGYLPVTVGSNTAGPDPVPHH